MRSNLTIFFFLAMIGLFSACNTGSPVTATPQGDRLAPTEDVLNTPLPSPDPQNEPATPTREVFNPLDPSPTPSGSDLPLTCQVTDLNVQIDQAVGYCFAYPLHFTYGTQPFFNVPAVMGPAVGSATEPVYATFYVEAAPANPDQSLDQQAEAFLKDFTTVDPTSLSRTSLTLGGEDAVMVDQVPGYLSWRIVFAAHDGKLYRLMYWPVDVPEAQADFEELVQTTLNSFAFLPGE
jgi:hypothetical protein